MIDAEWCFLCVKFGDLVSDSEYRLGVGFHYETI